MADEVSPTKEFKQGGRIVGSSDPAVMADLVGPDDVDELPNYARALYVGTGGDVRIVTLGDSDVIFKNVPSGTILPVGAKKVFTTSMSATDIVAIL